MKTFLAFTFNKISGDLLEQGFGRVIIEGVPDSTAKIEAVEQALLDGLKKESPEVDFTRPTITCLTILPEVKSTAAPKSRLIHAR